MRRFETSSSVTPTGKGTVYVAAWVRVLPGKAHQRYPVASSDTSTEITVTWKAPSETGGSPIHTYVVDRKAQDADWEDGYRDIARGTTSITDDGLAPGVEFCYRISAINTAHDADGNDIDGLEGPESTVVCATA